LSTDLQHKKSENVLHVRVPKHLHDVAKALAKARACSVSDLMRGLLVAEAQAHEPLPAPKPRRSK